MRLAALVVLALSACGETPTPPDAAPPAAEAPPEPAPQPDKPSNAALVPSPAQVQAALAEHGITVAVDALAQRAAIAVTTDNKDELAVRVGVQLAILVLTAKQAEKAAMLERLAALRAGFEALGAGADVRSTIDEISTQLLNDAINSDDLVAELDELARVLVPEVSYEAGERAIPLIQAGGWLAGSNAVAQAIVAAGKPEAAEKLLKHPEVVDYFLTYVKTEASDKAPPPVLATLEASLTTLRGVAGKEVLTLEDLQVVSAATHDVLTLL